MAFKPSLEITLSYEYVLYSQFPWMLMLKYFTQQLLQLSSADPQLKPYLLIKELSIVTALSQPLPVQTQK